jgi:hypothetical protein
MSSWATTRPDPRRDGRISTVRFGNFRYFPAHDGCCDSVIVPGRTVPYPAKLPYSGSGEQPYYTISSLTPLAEVVGVLIECTIIVTAQLLRKFENRILCPSDSKVRKCAVDNSKVARRTSQVCSGYPGQSADTPVIGCLSHLGKTACFPNAHWHTDADQIAPIYQYLLLQGVLYYHH